MGEYLQTLTVILGSSPRMTVERLSSLRKERSILSYFTCKISGFQERVRRLIAPRSMLNRFVKSLAMERKCV